ncbi:MAG: hypothetical protein PHW69_06390 [Elusimicrobiaceae bacterium]|nr:hypothetical protein [Elusimicrobiaceae bacterium]
MKRLLTTVARHMLALGMLSCAAAPVFASFEDVGLGPKPTAMGGAYTAQGEDLVGAFYNPAALAGVNRMEAIATYEKMFLGLTDGSSLGTQIIGLGYPLTISGKYRGTLGINMQSFSLDSLYSESTLMLSYARRFGKDYQAGLSIRKMSITYGSDEYTKENPTLSSGGGASGMGFDIGLVKLGPTFNWGFSVINLNQPSVAIKYANPVGRIIRGGISLKRRFVTWNTDLLMLDSGIRLKTGAEYRLKNRPFALRGGMNLGAQSYRNLTFGLGYTYGALVIDYAFELPLSGIAGTMGNHQFGITYRWGRERFTKTGLGTEPADEFGPSAGPGGSMMTADGGAAGAGAGLAGATASAKGIGGENQGEVVAKPSMPTDAEKQQAAEALERAKKAILVGGDYSAGMREINSTEASMLTSRDLQEMEQLKLKMEPVERIYPSVSTRDKKGRLIKRAIDKYITNDGRASLDAATYARQLWPGDATLGKLSDLIRREFPDVAAKQKILPNMTLVEQRLQEALEFMYEDKNISAITLCQEVLDLDPENVLALTRMGSAYWGMGYDDAARSAWKKALVLDPNNADLKQFINQDAGSGRKAGGSKKRASADITREYQLAIAQYNRNKRAKRAKEVVSAELKAMIDKFEGTGVDMQYLYSEYQQYK